MYQVPDKSAWKGRVNPSEPEDLLFHQVVHLLDMTNDLWLPDKEINIALIGFCSDEGVKRNLGRPGARNGPYSLRKYLAGLAVHFDTHTKSIVDAGNVICNEGKLESASNLFEHKILALLNSDFFPLVIGGGHETSYPHFSALRKHFKEKKLGIINFDAHFDMRTYENGPHSGSSFRNIMDDLVRDDREFHYLPIGIRPESNTTSLFRIMDENRQPYMLMEDVKMNMAKVLKTIDKFLKDIEGVYITIDLDCFPGCLAPGVSAASPEGLEIAEIKSMLNQIFSGNLVIGADVVELNPVYDHDEITAKTAALLVSHLIHNLKSTT